MGRPAINLVGKIIGEWTILRRVGSTSTLGKIEPLWECRCSCGTIKEVTSSTLRVSKHCGCKSKENRSKARLIDLTGQAFGRLTVLELVDSRRGSSSLWKCRCSCGSECEVVSSSLRRGITRSCGCLAKEVAHNLSFKDETGNVFGRLTVIKPLEVRGGEWYFLCLCECGNETVVRGSHLRSGEIKSCMCLAHERHLEIATTHGLTYTAEYKRIQGRKRSQREKYLDVNWNAEKEVALRKMFPACIICGMTEEEHQAKHNQSLHVDHVLPLKNGNGLSESNAVVLCADCNRFKHDKDINKLPLDWKAAIVWNVFKFKNTFTAETYTED